MTANARKLFVQLDRLQASAEALERQRLRSDLREAREVLAAHRADASAREDARAIHRAVVGELSALRERARTDAAVEAANGDLWSAEAALRTQA